MVHSLQPPIQLTSPAQHHRLSSHLTPRTHKRVPRAAAAAGHGHDQRFEVEDMTCVRVPLRLPVVLSVSASYCVSAIGNTNTSGPVANANTNGHRYLCPPSAAVLSPSALAAAALPQNGTTHNDARLEPRTAGLLHDLRSRDGHPQTPRTQTPRTHCARVLRSGRRETSNAQWESKRQFGHQPQW